METMMTNSDRPKPNYQGQTTVERNGDEFLIMFPDGHIVAAITRAEAEQKIKRWYKENADDAKFNIGMIEWR